MHTSVRARFLLAIAGLVVLTLLGQGAIAAASVTGPDVSGWQHPSGVAIDWSAVKADGQSFTFIKATEGSTYQNPYFSQDWSGSLSAGLVRGAYHFARPSTAAGSAVAQANYFVAKAGHQNTAGTLPPVLDLEVNGGLSPSQLISWTSQWLTRVQQLTGRKPIIYSYPYFWLNDMANTTAFSAYPEWIAGYSSEPGPLGGWSHWTFWQYSSSKYIPGISGPGDISTYYGSITQLRAMALIGSGTAPVVRDPWLQGNDFNGDGKADIGVYRVSTGQWFIRNQGSVTWGKHGDIPVPGDYSGDGKANIAVFRPSTHTWYFRGSKPIAYGLPGDIPVPGDYSGDGRVHVAVYRPKTSTWYVRGQHGFHWGNRGDIPVPGNYNGGDGGNDFAVFRRSTGQWYIPGSKGITFGQIKGSEPLPARYDNSHMSFPSYWRSSDHSWAVRSHTSLRTGSKGNIPVAADVLGYGYAQRIIFNRANGGWYINNKRVAYYGGAGHDDIPITGSNIPLIGLKPLALR